MEAITFSLGGEHYALESRFAFEVMRLSEFARLPSSNRMIFGVMVWRGELITILDVRDALGLRSSALHDLTNVIVLGSDHPAFAILVDKAHEMRTLTEDDIETTSGTGTHMSGRRYARGITRDAITILDAPALLALHG